jgi:hypothetical protein
LQSTVEAGPGARPTYNQKRPSAVCTDRRGSISHSRPLTAQSVSCQLPPTCRASPIRLFLHQRDTQICLSRPGASQVSRGRGDAPLAMEPGLSIESGSAIRVAVLPVGGPIPPPRLREYAALVARHARVDLASLRTYYAEHQKSPFQHQPWETGCLRLKFVLGGCVPSPWEDFQSSRKVLAVIGICHLPSSPDLDRVAADFIDAARSYPSALANRCFAFCPTDAQVHSCCYRGRVFQSVRNCRLSIRRSSGGLRCVCEDRWVSLMLILSSTCSKWRWHAHRR